MFVVRSENSYGLSIPSGISALVRTSAVHMSTSQHMLENARAKLNNKVLVLRDLFALSSTSVRVVWDVSKYDVLRHREIICFKN